MAKKRDSRTESPAAAPEERTAVTAERFTRLYRLLQYLAGGPKTRDRLTRQLNLDVRGFYRDLELLRTAGITIGLSEGRYALTGEFDTAIARLPFPDAHLTLGEARQLAKGRSLAHRYLREQIKRVVS